MDAEKTTLLIDAVGGDKAFARLLGIDDKPGFQQRVNNWKRRGMPADVVLDHLRLIQRLEKKLRQQHLQAHQEAA